MKLYALSLIVASLLFWQPCKWSENKSKRRGCQRS